MPPSSSIKGSDPAPPAATITNPAQCGTSDCITYIGCFTDLVGGVRAVPTPALQVVNGVAGNFGWLPLTCAAAAKKNGASLFSVQFGGECYYGTSMTDAIAMGPSTACTSTCTADSTKTNCGGGSANSLFTVV
jgi:hypothetical protein